MDKAKLKRLTEQAKEDPEFFHKLVFNTEEAIQGLDYLDRYDKSELLRTNPDTVLSSLAGAESSGCDVTCSSSCGATCAKSCGYTTNVSTDLEDLIINSAIFRRRIL